MPSTQILECLRQRALLPTLFGWHMHYETLSKRRLTRRDRQSVTTASLSTLFLCTDHSLDCPEHALMSLASSV